jgi:hypothetical protein
MTPFKPLVFNRLSRPLEARGPRCPRGEPVFRVDSPRRLLVESSRVRSSIPGIPEPSARSGR